MTIKDVKRIAGEIEELVQQLPAAGNGTIGDNQLKRARRELERAYAQVYQAIRNLDRTNSPDGWFDPSDPRLFGTFVALALMGQDRHKMSELDHRRFYGSGVYAIYVTDSDEPAYQPIVGSEHPIYVGKVNPKVPDARSPEEQGEKLWGRLKEHAKNIGLAQNLALNGFDYRALTVQTGWQDSAEASLITLFHPIWNKEEKICYGIGKHGDDAKTRGNKRSPWDVMHPGRNWAAATSLKDSKDEQEIRWRIAGHFETYPPLKTMSEIIDQFLSFVRETT
jgi:hypothetical protein